SRTTLPSTRGSRRRAHGVEIGDYGDQPVRALDKIHRPAVQRAVMAMQPALALRRVRADERVERAINAHEQKRELAFLAFWVDGARTGAQPRNAGLAHAKHAREHRARKAEQLGRAQQGFTEDLVGRRERLRGGTYRARHQMKG